MTAFLLDGKALAEKLQEQLAGKIRRLKQQTGKTPGLAYLLQEDDPASRHYAAGKTAACRKVGIYSLVIPFSKGLSQQELLAKIGELNANPDIHGILLQLPLPKHLDMHSAVARIDRNKDADGFHPYNRGLLFSSHPAIAPCTPKGVIYLLKENRILLEGKNVVILGRSLVVGRPLLMMLLGENATVTICHRQSRNLSDITRRADIVVAAIGSPKFLTREYVSRGTVVVDVGINVVNGKLVGDADFDDLREVASAMTPVPGGVGPMTVAMLLENTVHLFEQQLQAGVRRSPASKPAAGQVKSQ